MRRVSTQQHTRHQPTWKRDGKRGCIRLEPAFFKAFGMIAHKRGLSMIALIQEVSGLPRDEGRSLTSVLRCYVVEQLMPYYPISRETKKRKPRIKT